MNEIPVWSRTLAIATLARRRYVSCSLQIGPADGCDMGWMMDLARTLVAATQTAASPVAPAGVVGKDTHLGACQVKPLHSAHMLFRRYPYGLIAERQARASGPDIDGGSCPGILLFTIMSKLTHNMACTDVLSEKLSASVWRKHRATCKSWPGPAR